MPRRVNPVLLLGIVTVAVLSFGLSAGAAPEDGVVPKTTTIAPVEAPVKEPAPTNGGGAAAPEVTVVPEAPPGGSPETVAPVGETRSGEDAAREEEDDEEPVKQEDATSTEQEDDAPEEESPAQEESAQSEGDVAEGDVAEGDAPAEEAEIGGAAEEAGLEFEEMLNEATVADSEYDNALLKENKLNSEIAETSNEIATA